MPVDELSPLKMAQKWTRYMDLRMIVTMCLVGLCWLSGITWCWAHFDGCGLWNIAYPQNDGSRKILRVLRIFQILQTTCAFGGGWIWIWRMKKWRHGVCSQMSQASKCFGALMILDIHRMLIEICCLFIFYGFYVEAVAERPTGRVLLSWVVDLMAEGVVGVVPLFIWLIPFVLSFTGLFTLSSVWEEFCRQQTFNRRFSLYQFDKIITHSEDEEEGSVIGEVL